MSWGLGALRVPMVVRPEKDIEKEIERKSLHLLKNIILFKTFYCKIISQQMFLRVKLYDL